MEITLARAQFSLTFYFRPYTSIGGRSQGTALASASKTDDTEVVIDSVTKRLLVWTFELEGMDTKT